MTHTIPDIAALAKEAAGNWRRFGSFAWFRARELADADNWTIVYTSNRDSGLMEQSNAVAVHNALLPFMKGKNPDVVEESHSHWAVGHVDGFSIRVYRRGKTTKAFAKWCELKARRDDYPILDEDDYYACQSEAALENIKHEGERLARRHAIELPGDFEHEVYWWLSNNDDAQLDDSDDRGAYPSEEAVLAAFTALGWLRNQDRQVRGPEQGSKRT